MKGYRKILIAVNDSRKVLSQGLKLAQDEGCWVTVLKVIPAPEGDLNLTGVRNIDEMLTGGAGSEVREIDKIAGEAGALVKVSVAEGEIDEKIIETAKDEDCDLIVMGTRRKTWLERLFGQNIAEKVLSQAPCPVLFVGA